MTEINPVAPRKGVLLANLGTPAAPTRGPVARFLREFLSDPRVVDLPRALWLPLLYGVIVPIRAGRSAKAYREIWWEEGSPLLVLTERLAERLRGLFDDGTQVEVGMRYGEPSIRQGLERLREGGVDDVTVVPLYPQFSHTTTSSIFDAVDAALRKMNWRPAQRRIQDYHDHPGWVRAVADSILAFQADHGAPERLMFSLHGIPERYVRQGDPYRAQCERGVRAIAGRLGLADDEWLLTFQSRVGREPWLQPYTDLTLERLAAEGVRHVQVVCPGFAVDCLETLEEIAMQNRELFEEHGGETLEYVPALNDGAAHARLMWQLAQSGVGARRD